MVRRANENSENSMNGDDAALRIVVLADGPESETLATKIYEGLCARLPGGAATRLSVWRFDSINHRRTERAVDNDIREADVVMVAADGRQPLHGGAEMALGEWLLGPAAARFGLVEVLRGIAEEEKDGSPVHQYLKELTTEAGTEFLSHTASRADDEIVAPMLAGARPRGMVELLGNEDLLATAVPMRRWGINE